MSEKWTARVYILDAPYHIDKPYDYYVGHDLRGILRAGAFVTLPFGSGGRQRKALVVSLGDDPGCPTEKLKHVTSAVDEETWLSAEQLETCMFIKEHTFCTVGDAVRTMIPQKTAGKYITVVEATSAALEYIEGGAKLRSQAQMRILSVLSLSKGITLDVLKSEHGASSSQIKSLEEKGLIELTKYDNFRDPYAASARIERKENILNQEQEAARKKLTELLDSGEPKGALLHGITGSGKTRVIVAMTDEVLARGKQVIILVPEIALTPQTLGLFASFYGNDIAVLHSSLSAGERYDAWRRIKQGKVHVCIGTRSAIFAPFDNLGMIVIDEEQEHTYKSDSNPKYNAIDVARFRCAKNNALMLLASATPSLASYHKAVTGKYTLVELNQRYGDAKLPEATIYDMRDEYRAGNLGGIGSRLKNEISSVLDSGKQVIIFINRRGYNHYVSCPLCGGVFTCPHCSVSLTNHTHNGRGELRCHYCGYRTHTPDKCPECGGEHLNYVGYGTQKVEEELADLFPDKKIIRMDADTTSTKFAHDEILHAFREHQGDILLGTQMVTKGHDFPDVALSGILLADMSLYLDDYRANERTFSIVTQVIGRAGRAGDDGKAVIQTFNPDHPVLRMAARQDYKEFYKNEIALRRALVFPPFCDIFLVGFSGKRENEMQKCASSFTRELKKRLSESDGVKLAIFGPIEAPIYKVNEYYRMRLVVKGRSNAATRNLFAGLMSDFIREFGKSVSISIDVNPNTL